MRQTMIAKFGSEEAWKEHMRQLAKAGGSQRHPETRAFYRDRGLAAAAGQVGGRISKRSQEPTGSEHEL